MMYFFVLIVCNVDWASTGMVCNVANPAVVQLNREFPCSRSRLRICLARRLQPSRPASVSQSVCLFSTPGLKICNRCNICCCVPPAINKFTGLTFSESMASSCRALQMNSPLHTITPQKSNRERSRDDVDYSSCANAVCCMLCPFFCFAFLAGSVVFALIFCAATLMFIPGLILTIGAGVAFGRAFGFVHGLVCGTLSVLVGAFAACVIAFYMGR